MADEDDWRWPPLNYSTEVIKSSDVVKSYDVEIPFHYRVPENHNDLPYYKVAMSKVWRNLPMDIVKEVIDFMAADVYWNEWNEDEYDPVIRKTGLFGDWTRARPWNHLLAIGGIFRTEALRRLIRWDCWRFEDYRTFAKALHSWQNISPGSWKQIRILDLGEIRVDGSNHSEIMCLLPRVVMFPHLKLLCISFEVDVGLRGHVSRYFDNDGDLDETHPELFTMIEACRAPRAQIIGLENWKITQYLESAIRGEAMNGTRGSDITPSWRRPLADDTGNLGW